MSALISSSTYDVKTIDRKRIYMISPRVRIVSGRVLVVLLAVGYLLAGLIKFTDGAAPVFVNWGYAPWFAILIGVLELTGGTVC